jgi:hypothetical protein
MGSNGYTSPGSRSGVAGRRIRTQDPYGRPRDGDRLAHPVGAIRSRLGLRAGFRPTERRSRRLRKLDRRRGAARLGASRPPRRAGRLNPLWVSDSARAVIPTESSGLRAPTPPRPSTCA